MRAHVVDAHDVGAEAHGHDMGADRAEEPVARRHIRIVEAAEQRLARHADQHRKAERLDLGQAVQRFEMLVPALAEADAGVEHDMRIRNAGAPGEL